MLKCFLCLAPSCVRLQIRRDEISEALDIGTNLTELDPEEPTLLELLAFRYNLTLQNATP